MCRVRAQSTLPNNTALYLSDMLDSGGLVIHDTSETKGRGS